MWSAASATMVNVGFRAGALTNWLPCDMKRLAHTTPAPASNQAIRKKKNAGQTGKKTCLPGVQIEGITR